MISLKLSPNEARTEAGSPAAIEEPAYPYGLTLCLDDVTLAKLGITALPAAGKKFAIQALAEVVSTSQYENQDSKDLSVTLQITDMELSPSVAEARDPRLLYPNSRMD